MNKLMKMVMSLFFMVILLTGCVSIPTGDGGSVKLSKDGVKVKSEEGEETDIDVDTKEGGFSFKGKDVDGNETEMNISAGTELPKDFPAEIPLPKDAEIRGVQSYTDNQSKTDMVSFISKGEVAEYSEIYTAFIDERYDNISHADMGGMATHSGDNEDGEGLNVIILEDEAEGGVVITLTVSQKKEK